MKNIIFIMMAICILNIGCEKDNPKDDLFLKSSDLKGELTIEHGEEVINKQVIEIDLEKVTSGSVVKGDLFGNTVDFLIEERIIENNTTVISGKIEDENESYFLLSQYKDRINADFYYSKGKYQIKTVGQDIYELWELDADKFVGLKDMVLSSEIETPGINSNNCQSSANIADFAIYYTCEAQQGAGGLANIIAEGYHAVASTNKSFRDSQIMAFLNIVLVKKLAVSENVSSIADLIMSVNNTGSPQYTHPDVAMDKLNFHFDIGMLLISNKIGTSTGAAHQRAGSPFDAVIYDNTYSTFGSVAVSSRIHAVSIFTFQHEIGHLYGLNHECNNPYNYSTPIYNYAHGYCAPNSTNTIMGGEYCPSSSVLPYFSNPNLIIGGIAMGTSGTSNCEANAALAINNFANQLANYECQNGGLTDVIIKDVWTDNGNVPTNTVATDVIYNSVDVWNRQQNDGQTNEHLHEDVIYGQTNYLYVKLRNGFANTISGTVEIFYADANTNLSWSTGGGPYFTSVGTMPATVNGNSTLVVEIPWNNVPNPGAGNGHYCLYVRWDSSADPMQVTETSSIAGNTVYNNNIAWKNLKILTQSQILGGQTGSNVSVKVEEDQSFIQFNSTNEDRDEEFDFFNQYSVVMKIDEELEKFVEFELGAGIEEIGISTFSITSKEAKIKLLATDNPFVGNFNFTIKPKTMNFEPCNLNLSHYREDKLIGGYSYELRED